MRAPYVSRTTHQPARPAAMCRAASRAERQSSSTASPVCGSKPASSVMAPDPAPAVKRLQKKDGTSDPGIG